MGNTPQICASLRQAIYTVTLKFLWARFRSSRYVDRKAARVGSSRNLKLSAPLNLFGIELTRRLSLILVTQPRFLGLHLRDFRAIYELRMSGVREKRKEQLQVEG